VTPVVRSQRQVHAVYFDLSDTFDSVPHILPLHRLNSFGFSDGYVSWFRSYVTDTPSRVHVSGTHCRFIIIIIIIWLLLLLLFHYIVTHML
jgi:hypothetical protein